MLHGYTPPLTINFTPISEVSREVRCSGNWRNIRSIFLICMSCIDVTNCGISPELLEKRISRETPSSNQQLLSIYLSTCLLYIEHSMKIVNILTYM